MRLAGSTLRGSAEWLARGSQMQTRARVNLETRNSELLLKRLGYTSPIGDAPGKLALDLNWRDVPYRLSLPTLAGSADYQLEGDPARGQRQGGPAALPAEPRFPDAQAAPRFSRRLRQGLLFRVHVRLRQGPSGVVENNDFYMKGAAGNLRGKGIADLVRWRLDFDLSFSPNLGAPCRWWRPSP